ncbi:MAG: signal peptidase I [Oscillospiraceae bacterium]
MKTLADKRLKEIQKGNVSKTPKRKRNTSKGLFICCNILFTIMVLIVVSAFLFTTKTGRPVTFFGHSALIIATGSMEPEIPTNSLIINKKVPSQNLVVGDIITFMEIIPRSDEPVPICHRITKIIKTDDGVSFQTKGDMNDKPDEKTCTKDKIVGKVIAISPFAGKIVNFIRSPYGMICFLILPLGAILIYQFYQYLKIKNEDNDEEDTESFGKNTLYDDESFHRNVMNTKAISPLENMRQQSEFYELQKNSFSKYPAKNINGMNTRPLGIGLADFSNTTLQRPLSGKKIETHQDELDNFPNYKIVTKAEEEAQLRASMTALMEEPKQMPMPEQELDEEKIIENMGAFAFVKKQGDEPDDEKSIKLFNRFTSGKNDLALMSTNRTPEFNALVKKRGQDMFSLDGINVKVLPDSIDLNLEKSAKTKDISITVTKEYTNVVIDGKQYEINFALFKDKENNQKVTIEKKSKESIIKAEKSQNSQQEEIKKVADVKPEIIEQKDDNSAKNELKNEPQNEVNIDKKLETKENNSKNKSNKNKRKKANGSKNGKKK